MNWRRGRNSSPPGTGGVVRSAGVVDESNNSPPHFVHRIQGEPFRLYYHPGPSGHPSCSRRGAALSQLEFIHTLIDSAYMGAERFSEDPLGKAACLTIRPACLSAT